MRGAKYIIIKRNQFPWKTGKNLIRTVMYEIESVSAAGQCFSLENLLDIYADDKEWR